MVQVKYELDFSDLLDKLSGLLRVGLLALELDRSDLVVMASQRHCLTQEQRLVDAWCMQEDNICLLNMGLGFLHVLVDVLLEELLILSAHLRAHTGHDVGALILVKLSPALLFATHVLRVRSVEYLLAALEHL